MAGHNANKTIIIPKPHFETMDMDLIGLSPLLVNRWSEKAIRQIEEKQAKTAVRQKRAQRDPHAEFEAASYRVNGSYAFPSASFRLAAIGACRLIDGITMATARRLFTCPEEYVILEGNSKNGASWPEMDSRPIRLANGVADMRYRPLFWPWACTLRIRFFAGATTPEQIGNLIVLAGECIGIGELRPEKGGNLGRFTIAEGRQK
jgi:hypothetical protein